jgi:hypothetical protein
MPVTISHEDAEKYGFKPIPEPYCSRIKDVLNFPSEQTKREIELKQAESRRCQRAYDPNFEI